MLFRLKPKKDIINKFTNRLLQHESQIKAAGEFILMFYSDLLLAFRSLSLCILLFGNMAESYADLRWGDFKAESCTTFGSRQYSAELLDIPWKKSPEEACASTPADIKEQHFDKPNRCKKKMKLNYVMMGEFDVLDTTCDRYIYPSTSHGSMLISDTNQSLAINAVGGVLRGDLVGFTRENEGIILKLVNFCKPDNYDCIWNFQYLTLNNQYSSNVHPQLSIKADGPAQHKANLTLESGYCGFFHEDCTWTYKKGMLINDANPSLAINAYGGAKHGTVLKLVNNCQPTNPDCTWTFRNFTLVSNTNKYLAMKAVGGLHHGASLSLDDTCMIDEPDCTWTYQHGMIISSSNPSLALNAYGGAKHGTVLKLVNNCQPTNPDCTWTYRKEMLFSDTVPKLAVTADGGARLGAALKLVNDCPPNNPDCQWSLLRTPWGFPNPSLWGWADMHAHPFAYEGFGGSGSIFFGKAYGPRESALPHCDSTHGLGGINDIVGMVMGATYYNKFQWGHWTSGDPEFSGWPRWNDLTHQSMHEEWLKRAVQGGMHLMVALAVNNEWMCETAKGIDMNKFYVLSSWAFAHGGPEAAIAVASSILVSQISHSQEKFVNGNVRPECKDMPSVDRQIEEAYKMQSYIDNQSGGPGQGWFRIVLSPAEAKDVIRQNKLAVILGVEVDNLFECYFATGLCTLNSVKEQLDKYWVKGVRHVFPIHFYDNGFGGSANSNFLVTNNFKNPMQKRDCRELGYTYDDGRCNARGLTDLGKSLIRELACRGMIIDTDHMSALAFKDTMDILETMHYPAVSGHTGFTELEKGSKNEKNNEGNRTLKEFGRILNSGGMVAVIPHQGNLDEITTYSGYPKIEHTCGNSSETVAQAYLYAVGHGASSVGIGTDFNGFASEPGPRVGPEACPGGTIPGYQAKPSLVYPFTINTTGGKVIMGRANFGQRTYDYNYDGLSHIGLVPDMIADFQTIGMGPKDLDPLFGSALGYVSLWERALESSKCQ